VNIAQYIFQKVVILVKSAHFIRSNTGNTGKFCRYLPVLKSPKYRKTGFGIAGIGNTTTAPSEIASQFPPPLTFKKNKKIEILIFTIATGSCIKVVKQKK
jgi:hypothetical protein